MYDKYTLIAYGCGKNCLSYLERLDKYLKIDYFCDINSLLWGKKIYSDNRRCLSPSELKSLKNPFVILTLDKQHILLDVQKYLDEEDIPYMHAKDILEIIAKNNDNDITSICWPEVIQKNRIHRFIDINLVGTTSCNLHCEYCYVWRNLGFHGENKLSDHSISDLCDGFSVERTGGVCFINMCARGETLLANGIVELTRGLLQQGHYVSIVTNGTITRKIEEILCFPQELLERLFFKFSFHYKELKRLSLFKIFWSNVVAVKNSHCSYTLEVTPGDSSESLIKEIKNMCLDKVGALPHVSFTRDSKKIGYDLLSEHSIETYKEIWGQFDSKMFDLKANWYGKNMRQYNCYAGAWSYLVNAVTGDIKACYQRSPIGNIFDKEGTGFPVKAVRRDCCIEYCFNNHAFLAWGCLPEIECSDYRDMRDRISVDGDHWLKEPVYSFMNQKLKENNLEYIDRWSDYEKLYAKERNKAFILFNSPDYPNLGDHAIALGEKTFFSKYFKEYDFIEISCTQYMKENIRIKSAINKDDIVLITGGGNTGDCYLWIQDMVTHIIQTYKDNRIIIAPQSMYFEGEAFSKSEMARIKTIYEQHDRLFIIAREKRTYQLYMKLFCEKVNKIKSLDMAFGMDYYQDEKEERNDGLVCLRNDKESQKKLNKETIMKVFSQYNLSAFEYSTISSDMVFLDNRQEKVNEVMKTISKAKIVVTDRLHCMIFCILTDTPCVVFDNVTGKLSAVLEEISECTNVVLCKGVEKIESAVQAALRIKPNNRDMFISIYQEFENLAGKIRKFIM